jgi:glycerophosphoryl diester phosphodiesterase
MATSEHPVRPLIAVIITLGLVLAIILSPQVSRVYASNVFGELRAPGDPAFIAGHRGDRSTAPENTIPALEAAS